MTQLSMIAQWMTPPKFDPADMVAVIGVMGEPAAVVMLCGEPWLGVVSFNGVRRTVSWDRIGKQEAVQRVRVVARELGLRVQAAQGVGDVRVGGVALAVSDVELHGNAVGLAAEEAGCPVVCAVEGGRERDLRAKVLEVVRRERRARREARR